MQNSATQTAFAQIHANMRDDQDFDAAHRHSKLVAILKNALPICALVVVILFVLLAVTTTIPLPGLEIDRVGLQEGKLIMENPKLVGFDRRSRPYDVGAQQAIQDLARPSIVELKSIAAKLPMDASSFAKIRANSGTFDTESERLILQDTVSVKGAKGMDLQLLDADIDIKSGIMKSDNPVKVTSKTTTVSADSVWVEQNGKRIVFNKQVKMTINRPVERGLPTTHDAASTGK